MIVLVGAHVEDAVLEVRLAGQCAVGEEVDELGAGGQMASVLEGAEERPWSRARAPDEDAIARAHALDRPFGRDRAFTPVGRHVASLPL